MAKKTYTHEYDPNAPMGAKITVVEEGKPTKAQLKSLQLIPATPAPRTRWEKIKRNLVG
jgi:hypothetical protein